LLPCPISVFQQSKTFKVLLTRFTGAIWLAIGILAHHRLQEVNTPQSEADEMTTEGKEIVEMMGGISDGAAALAAQM
jgi:hypothetical protein